MVLPFGVSWLGTLLLWGCLCFPPQIGYNIAHGYSVNASSSHAGVLGPQTSNQFHSGISLNTNHDSISPWDEMQTMGHQSFVSLQQEPVHQEDASSVTSPSEEMEQSKPDSGYEPDTFSAVPSVQKHEHESSEYHHPFGLLLKEHTQRKNEDGISFPTMRNFKQFIQTMKSSFLTPGSDISRHFQTAREIMKNEVAPKAQNIKEEPNTGYRSYYGKEGTAHDDTNENEVWSEPMNAAFEQSEQGSNYHMPSESLSVPDPVNSTASLISTSVYDSQDSVPGSAPYPRPHLAATEHVSSNYGGFEYSAISGENPDIFTSAPDVENEEVQSTSYKHSDQIPSGSFYGEDFSFSGHVTASSANLPNSPTQDFSYYSSKTSDITPQTSENNFQQTTYTPQSKDSSTGYQKPSHGFEFEGFQSEEVGRVIPANVLSAPNPPFLTSYGKSLYVNAPRGQHHIPDYLPKHRERLAPSFQPPQPTVDKESMDINYTPIVNLPVSSGSVSSRSDNHSPQSSSGHVGVQKSSPHDAPNQERSDLSKQNLVSATQELKALTDNTLIPISGGLDSTQSGIPSPAGVDYASFNSLTNLAPTTAAFSRLVGDKVTSRNFGIKNMFLNRFPTGHMHGARNHLGFYTPQRKGMSLDGGYVGATGAGLLQTFIQPTKIRKHPANVNKEPGNMSYWPKWLPASKVSGSTLSGVFWKNAGNTKRHAPRTGPSMSTPSVNSYIVKSRNSYVRGRVSLSKTHYAPYQLDEGKNW